MQEMHVFIRQLEEPPTLMATRLEVHLLVLSDPKVPIFKGPLFIGHQTVVVPSNTCHPKVFK